MLENDGIMARELGVHLYKQPPPGFDPISATDDELATFGLPERPDVREEPELFAFWEEMLMQSEFIIPAFNPKNDIPSELFDFRQGTKLKRSAAASARALRARGHLEDSRNWSGAYITPLRPNRFVYVAGAFTVPYASVPLSVPAGADIKATEYRSSTWIGTGGQRPYNSLPQIGVTQRVRMVANGPPERQSGAWWQWWVKGEDDHGFPIEILRFPVETGHRILASLRVQTSGDVHFCLKNQTTRKFVTFLVNPPKGILPLGSTAEWIHERPMKVGRPELYPLPSTTGVDFDYRYCLATSIPQCGAPETTQKLHNPRFIRMYEVFDHPHRSAFVSIPSIVEREGERYLHVRYREEGK